MKEQTKPPLQEKATAPPVHYDTRLPKLTFTQRALIPMIGWVVWAVIRIIGPTIRFEVLGGKIAGRDYRPDLPPNVYAFWHRCIIAGTWYFRNRNAVLLIPRISTASGRGASSNAWDIKQRREARRGEDCADSR